MIDEERFHTLADETLTGLFDAIEAAASEAVEADFEEGILMVELQSKGQYVVNRHTPNRQMWLSSPLSGAYHFDYDEASGQWVDSRAGGAEDAATLAGVLLGELAAETGAGIGGEETSPGES